MTLSEHRAATTRWQESQRKSTPASLEELAEALKRLWTEAARLAEHAYVAIQKHSFGPYWTFRAKLGEHAALVTVIRGRLAALAESHAREADALVASVDREEQEMVILAVKACLKFCFALSANPSLPVGARETFGHEIEALGEARRLLEQWPAEKLPEGMLDELGTAQMILEEIIAKSPSLADFDRPAAAAEALSAA
jgi:hypothetical protein